jgi:hypothetical protein
MLSIIPEETQAILIGTSKFPKDQGLCPLPGVVNNVKDLADLLLDQQIIGIPQTNITTLLDKASSSEVVSRLAEQARKATDTLVIYYAGHGLIGRSNSVARKLLLSVGDTTIDNSAFNALEFEKLRNAIDESPARKKILILDCCYSGRALSKMSDNASFISNQVEIRGAYTITSTPSNDEADAPEGERYTAFSGKLIQALQEGLENQKPVLHLDDLYEYIRSELLKSNYPEPQRHQLQDGDQIAIARNRKFRPLITTEVALIGDADDVTVQAYRIAAKECLGHSQWRAYDRRDVCFASDPTSDVCRAAAINCGIYIALLGSYYGDCYKAENVSHTEYELKIAEEYQKKIIVFVLPEESDVSPPFKFIKAQGPYLEHQSELKVYVEGKPQFIVHCIESPEDLSTKLQETLATIAKELEAQQPQNQIEISTQFEPCPQRVDFLGEYNHLSYDRRPVLTHTFKELDQKLINHFLAQPQAQDALRQAGLLRASTQEHLQQLGLLIDSRPTLGTFLCFSPRSLLVNTFGACCLAMSVFDQVNKGVARSSPERVTDNLLNLLEQGMTFLRTKSGLERTGDIGTESRDELEIPDIALREALANALVHRDYEQQRDQATRIDVFPDRVEITSFGEALVDLNQDPNEIISTKRNHSIAEIFRIMQRVELNASGISRMHEVMRAAKLLPPIIKENDNPAAVKVIFRRPKPDKSDTLANPDFTLSESFVGPSLLKAGAPFQAPPLPSYFVDRPEYRKAIKEYVLSRTSQIDSAVLNSASKANTLVVSAIYGLGGIGKSVLANAIAHDREVHAQFPDGIFWVTLGQNLIFCRF